MDVIQLLLIAFGAMWVGVALTLGFITALSAHHAGEDRTEGCLSFLAWAMPLGLAALCFVVAAGSG